METILLAVTGMAPAVLTETIWALAHEPEPLVPSRVVAVTTTQGRARIEAMHAPSPRFGGRSPWQALRESIAQRCPAISPSDLLFEDIRVITAPDRERGRAIPLDDLRTRADNESAADFLMETVRGLVGNPDVHLVVSIAGGRKTMGALLYACMTLVGRETDRLTHVLVNEPFDTLKDFWFPGQGGDMLISQAGSFHQPEEARVELADVPFVPLRNMFQRELGRAAGSFQHLVFSCREAVRHRAAEHLRLTVRTDRTEIDLNGDRTRLSPREHLVLLFVATRCKQSGSPILSYRDAVEPLNDFRVQLRQDAPASNLADWRQGDSLNNRIDDDDEIRRALSSLRQKLKTLGADGATLASLLPEKGRFTLDLPPSLIHVA